METPTQQPTLHVGDFLSVPAVAMDSKSAFPELNRLVSEVELEPVDVETVLDYTQPPTSMELTFYTPPRPLLSKKRRIRKKWLKKYGVAVKGWLSGWEVEGEAGMKANVSMSMSMEEC